MTTRSLFGELGDDFISHVPVLCDVLCCIVNHHNAYLRQQNATFNRP
jgi:hypothetical protein